MHPTPPLRGRQGGGLLRLDRSGNPDGNVAGPAIVQFAPLYSRIIHGHGDVHRQVFHVSVDFRTQHPGVQQEVRASILVWIDGEGYGARESEYVKFSVMVAANYCAMKWRERRQFLWARLQGGDLNFITRESSHLVCHPTRPLRGEQGGWGAVLPSGSTRGRERVTWRGKLGN